MAPSKSGVLPESNPSRLCTVCSLRSQTESLTAILLIWDVGQLLMASKCFSSPYCPAVFGVAAAQTASTDQAPGTFSGTECLLHSLANSSGEATNEAARATEREHGGEGRSV